MTIEQMNRCHKARPFIPFSIFIGDGREISVDHPEMLAYQPKARTSSVWVDGAYEIIDLLLVTSLKPRVNRKKRAS